MKVLLIVALLITTLVDAGRPIPVSIHHDSRDAMEARGLMVNTEMALLRLKNEFGLQATGPLTIVLAGTNQAFAKAQPKGFQPPAWAAGVAYPGKGLIILKSKRVLPNQDVRKVLAHELSHIVLGESFGKNEIPTWLNEGLTMHLADDWGVNRQIAMIRALSTDRLLKLDDILHGFPDNPIDAETAYAQSYYFISFLRDRFGNSITGRLIGYLSLGVQPEHALHRSTGFWLRDLEDEYSDWISNRFSIFFILTGPGAMWVLAALLLFATYIIRRRAAARKMAQWEAEENGAESNIDGPGGSGPPGGVDRSI